MAIASVTKPGVISKAPASNMNTPSSTGPTGGRPCAIASCARRATVSPWRAIIAPPISAATTSKPSVGHNPILCPVLTSSASSTNGKAIKARPSASRAIAPPFGPVQRINEAMRVGLRFAMP
jgi:hypothetical protein